MGVHGRSSWESVEEEEEGWDSEVQTLSWEEEEGWEDERRSWELGAEEAESGAERVESERHCDGREGVFAVFPSGTSTPSFSSTSEPAGDTTNKPTNQSSIAKVLVMSRKNSETKNKLL